MDLEVFINGVIKRVIESMMDTVDFNSMIAHIANGFGDLPIENFRKNFEDVLFRYGYQKNILAQAANLLNKDIKDKMQELLIIRSRGIISENM